MNKFSELNGLVSDLNVTMNPTNHKNHEAINTIIMAVKKRICYKDRLKTHDTATIN